jgi:hypothetical protein
VQILFVKMLRAASGKWELLLAFAPAVLSWQWMDLR